MSKLIDLTGQRFGLLTVLHLSENRSSSGKIYWACKCDCGTVVDVLAGNLTSGHTTSCGCKRTKPYIDKQYGKWTVLEKTNEKVQHGSTVSPLWKCQCGYCGKVKLLRLDSVTSGNIKSCGCTESVGKLEKMREAAGFIGGTQVSKIRRILEYNAAATDKVFGVYTDKGRWRAVITFRGKKHHLGFFDTKGEAIAARRKAEQEVFGGFLEELGKTQ